ncbi:MAG: hypothetical protein MUO76_15305, partial [Anaerolineaceae bacterium]|nr:hypothetical protein [Anaerolineaceae bacterium]
MVVKRNRIWFMFLLIMCLFIPLTITLPGKASPTIIWQTETLDGKYADVGYNTALALDSSDHPVISYYDATNGDLKIARFDGSQWQFDGVDLSAPHSGSGEGTTIALDEKGIPTVAYYQAAKQTLHIATSDGYIWSLVAATVDAGFYPDLTLDDANTPHISHYKLTDQDLIYTFNDGKNWVNETVDSTGNVGLYTSIALDILGNPHISYYDSTHMDLRYAVFGTGGWITQTLDSVGDVGKGTSLALTENGYPIISYIDSTQSDLKIASFDGKTWVTATVDSSISGIGDYTALVLGAFDRPHIAYEVIDSSTSALKYAYFNGTTWLRSLVDNSASVGRYPAMTLDSSGSPVISYYDIDNGDLKLAREYIPDPPDLVITDIWHEGSILWYQVMNTGPGNAHAGHHTSMNVDGSSGKVDLVGVELAPDERASRQFSDGWGCTTPTSTVDVCIDSRSEITETNESNNCRQEVWSCDTEVPKIISGPDATILGPTTALVTWETDEDCAGNVTYGTRAGVDSTTAIGASSAQVHTVNLYGLSPGTLYHFAAVCTDIAGNTVRSKDGVFETAPPTGNTGPVIKDVIISLVDGYSEYYTVDVQTVDDYGVDNVAFYLDGELLGTDHTASSPYMAAIHPALLAMTQDVFYAPHVISATVTDGHGDSATWADTWQPAGEPSVEAVWHQPNSVIYSETPIAAPGVEAHIAVSVNYVYRDCINRLVPDIPPIRLNDLASLGEMRIAGAVIGVRESQPLPIGATASPVSATGANVATLCDETRVPATDAWLFINGARILSYPGYDAAGFHEYNFNLNGYNTGSTFTLSVNATEDSVTFYPAPETHTFTLMQGQPAIEVERQITRNGNSFDIALTVTNIGTSNISQLVLENKLTGFQPISIVKAEYDVGTSIHWHSDASWDLSWFVKLITHPNEVLAPGNSLTMVYQAVPVLAPEAYDGHRTQGRIHNLVDVSYVAGSGDTHVSSIDLPAILTTDGYYIDQAIALAIQSADYLIITDPDRILDFEPRQYYTNTSGIVDEVPYVVRDSFVQLFNMMGEFARRKNAVIGFVNGQDRMETNDLIREWGSRMDCHYATGILECDYFSRGYLLIVGEMEIVAPFAPVIKMIGYAYRTITDQVYANTSGNVFNPELSAGRISGNNAYAYAVPLATSIHLDMGTAGFQMDRSKALLAQGFSSCRSGECDTGDYRNVISAARIPLL